MGGCRVIYFTDGCVKLDVVIDIVVSTQYSCEICEGFVLPLFPNSFTELYLFGSKEKDMFDCDSPRISFACRPPVPIKLTSVGGVEVEVGSGQGGGDVVGELTLGIGYKDE